jgi:hypothetical protein
MTKSTPPQNPPPPKTPVKSILSTALTPKVGIL